MRSEKELLDEFIVHAKSKYGYTIRAVETDTPDSFEKIFGGSFSNQLQMQRKSKNEDEN